jgi:HSP20 family protein
MTLARRPSPFGELLSLRQAMDRLFEDSFVRSGSGAWGFGPMGAETMALPLDVATTNDELVIQATLPGVKPDEVDITVENGTLTIRGETTSERNEGEGDYLVREIRRGTFSRSISLPGGLEPDKATASFDNGMLTLRVPKAEQVKPRQIRISPTVDGQTNGRDTKKVSAATTGTSTTSTTGTTGKAGTSTAGTSGATSEGQSA